MKNLVLTLLIVMQALLAQAQIPLSTLPVDGRLLADSSYVLTADLYLSGTDTLTIEHGVQLDLAGHGIYNQGTFIANGTRSDSINIYSSDSLTFGCGLGMGINSWSSISYVKVAGILTDTTPNQSWPGATIRITYAAYCKISHSTISDNTSGLYMYESHCYIDSTTIQHNLIDVKGDFLSVSNLQNVTCPLILLIASNGRGSLRLPAYSSIPKYKLIENLGQPGDSLVIDPGVIIDVAAYFFGGSNIVAVGTLTDSIIIHANASQFGQMYISGNGVSNLGISKFKFVKFITDYYVAIWRRDTPFALTINENGASVKRCSFDAPFGLQLVEPTSITLDSLKFQNFIFGLANFYSTITISNSSFLGEASQYGITAETDYVLAKNCYFGALSGPFHEHLNPRGRGARISDNVCLIPTPNITSLFDVVRVGHQVSFINRSQYMKSCLWDFGDGTSDTVANPVHVYRTSRAYPVKLIARQFCNADTASFTLSTKRISSISPDTISRTGPVTIYIYGSGFDSTTRFKFYNSNQIFIPLDSSLNIKNHSMAILHISSFSGDIGSYDIIAYDNNGADTLFNSIYVSPAFISGIECRLIGANILRLNNWNSYFFNAYNPSNADLFAVPATFELPTKFDANFPTISTNLMADTLMQMPFFAKIENMRGDSVDVYKFIIPYLPARGFYQLPLQVRPNSLNEAILGSYSNDPMYTPPSPGSRSFDNAQKECIKEALLENSKTARAADCMASAMQPTIEQITKDCQRDLDATTCDYTEPGCAARQDQFLSKDYLALPAYNLIKDSYRKCSRLVGPGDLLPADLADIYDKIEKATKLIGEIKCFFKKEPTEIKVRPVFSRDPNYKFGPSGMTAENYNRGLSPYSYTVQFENVDTATAAAQVVEVIDTLNRQVLDLNTFQLVSFSFGDSINYKYSPGMKEFSTTLDLRPGQKLLVRVDAKLDTISGILLWRFLSLDPATKDLLVDTVDGFLPPNTIGRRGEGYVSYSVQPKAGLQTGAQIRNKASIVFDANAPIVTNTFLNTIDKTLPTSHVEALSPQISDTAFKVRWTGQDAHSGRRSFDVYVETNNGPFRLWQYDTYQDSATFYGHLDSTYAFFSIAKDNAGNIEGMKITAEASTQITVTAPRKNSLILTIYPNPTSGFFTLDTYCQGPAQVQITDALGHLLIHTNLADGHETRTLDLTRQLAGIYWVKVKSAVGTRVQKLVKY